MIVCFGTTPAVARTMRFDAVKVGGVNRARTVHTYAAGKAVNAARAVHRLGEAVMALGVEGGMHGGDLLALLTRDLLPHEFLHVSAPTRLCVTVIDDQARGATELIEDAPPMEAAEGDALLGLLDGALEGAAVAVLSGSLARGLPADYYARCIRLARARGARVVLDTSGPALREALVEKPDLVKINSHELAGLSGAPDFQSDAEVRNAARSVAGETDGTVIITRGAASTLAVDAADVVWRVEPLQVERVVSPIGCGDSFSAGVAVAIARGMPMDEALALGTACALANLETPHAAHFTPEGVEQYRQRVQVVAG